jgi:hypothetical protein
VKAAHAVRAVTWLPILTIIVLLGWGLSWWVTVVALAYLVVVIVPSRLYARRLRRRFAHDPEARRAYSERAERRLARWGRGYGLMLVAMLVGLCILLLVLALTGHTSGTGIEIREPLRRVLAPALST